MSGIIKWRSGTDSLPPEYKWYLLHNPATIKYNDGRIILCSMGWSNLIVGSCFLHNVVKAYVNVINTTTAFTGPTQQTKLSQMIPS